MNDITTLLDEAQKLLDQETPSTSDIRRMMVEMDELINSDAFSSLEPDDRTRLQTIYKELRNATRDPGNPAANQPAGFETSLPKSSTSVARTKEREHNPYAEQQMEEAEKLFYGGRYAEAIKLYDQVLKIEPSWDRAQQHRNESENYLRTGYIPSVALPAEAATAFGKAQSAARLGRYMDAMGLLSKAQSTLREMGIQRWQEGQDFEQKLQQNIDAESVYDEGLQLFARGNIDEGIDRVETAARATGLPKYNDKAQELRKIKSTMQTIAETLNASVPDPKVISQAKVDIDRLLLEYDDNPAMLKLKTRLDTVIPKIIEPMKDQIRVLKTQADRAQTMESVKAKAREAKQILDHARYLGHIDSELDQQKEEIDKLFREVQRYEDELQQANTVLNTNRSWPAAAARMSQELRARYPNDPGVIELNRALGSYRHTLTLIKIGAILVGVVVIVLLLLSAARQVRAYVVSLTPTATNTPTLSPTSTPHPPTATPTQKPTNTPTLTPTPLMGTVAREVWVRNGCYETFPAIGRVPSGSSVRFMPGDRRFDNLNRECLLVEYDTPDGQSLIGWILIADLGQ